MSRLFIFCLVLAAATARGNDQKPVPTLESLGTSQNLDSYRIRPNSAAVSLKRLADAMERYKKTCDEIDRKHEAYLRQLAASQAKAKQALQLLQAPNQMARQPAQYSEAEALEKISELEARIEETSLALEKADHTWFTWFYCLLLAAFIVSGGLYAVGAINDRIKEQYSKGD